MKTNRLCGTLLVKSTVTKFISAMLGKKLYQNLIHFSKSMLFMLSLVPELKKVPDAMKLDIKTDLINVFTRARLQHPIPTFGPVPSHRDCFNARVAHPSQQCNLYSMADLPAK
jgi:hypothetical protein